MKITRRNDLSLRLLEVFGILMLHQTTVAAAEELGISQPSVSTAIKKLEKQVGFALFDRQKTRMLPTQDAKMLFEEIEPLFEQLRSIESRVRDLRGGALGKLRLMATPPLGHSIVPSAFQKFLQDRPGVTIQYDVRRMEHVIDAVATGKAEIGLCLGVDDHSGVNVERLRTDRMVALMPATHPLAELPVIGPKDLATWGVIGLDPASRLGFLLKNAFQTADVPYEPQVLVRYCHTAAVLAHSGSGIAIVDHYTAAFIPNMDLVIRPFAPSISVSTCLLTRPGRLPTVLTETFVNVLKTMLAV